MSRRLWSVKSGGDDRATPPRRTRSHSHPTRRSANPEGGRRNGDRDVQPARSRRSTAHETDQQRRQTTYRFSFGPWNISTGADPFGPTVRQEMEYARKLRAYKELGFDAVQFHDDDIVPADLDWPSTQKRRGRRQEDPRRRGALRRDHRPPALGRPADDRRGVHRRITPPTGSTRSIGPGGASTSPARSAARTTSSGWLARGRTSARPRTPRRASLGSSMPGTPSSSTTRTSGSWAKPSPTSRWTRPTCRPSAT